MARGYVIGAILFAAAVVRAGESVLPVVTEKVSGRVFSTTVVVENTQTLDATCAFTYRSADRGGQPLVSKETIAAGKTAVYEDFLSDIAAAGSVGIECSHDVSVFVRVQDSEDGQRFRPGRLYRPVPIENAQAKGTKRKLRVIGDLALLEVGGERVQARVLVSSGGQVLGENQYAIPSYGQRVINLDRVFAIVKNAEAEIEVTGGNGRIVVQQEIVEPALAGVAMRREGTTRPVASSLSRTPPARVLGICPFQAGPFFEPATGLCYFRNRWYDRQTGTFVSPDARGYADSSNLYAFAGGDPVNGRDPLGLATTKRLIRGKPGQTASVSGVTFDSRADYINYLIGHGVSLDQAMFAADTSGYASEPAAPNAIPIFRRAAAMASPFTNRLEGGFGLIGAVAQGYGAAESLNPTLGLLALNNAWASSKLIINGRHQPTFLGKYLNSPGTEIGVNIAAGLTPGFRGSFGEPAPINSERFRSPPFEELDAGYARVQESAPRQVLLNKAAGDAWEATVVSDVLPLTQEI